MAQFILNIDNALVDPVLSAICWKYGYTGPNTVADRTTFARLQVKKWVRDIVQEYQLSQAQDAAHAAALSSFQTAFNTFADAP